MKNEENKALINADNRKPDGSDKKSFQLVFWLLAAKIGFILLIALLAVWLIFTVRSGGNQSHAAIHFSKVLGSGYTENGKQLWISAKSGNVFYQNGTWKKSPSSKATGRTQLLPVANGYIQINEDKTAEAKNVDGQAASSVRLPNLSQGGFWAAGYQSGAFYYLKGGGGTMAFSYSPDSGKTWTRKNLNGILGEVNAVAAHPQKRATFAIATTRGLFLTTDGGSHFKTFLKGENVTSASFGFGRQTTLLAGTLGDATALYSVIPADDKMINLDMSSVEKDKIVQIPQNPAHSRESAVVTESGDVYLTTNGGQNWTILAQRGRGLSTK